MNSQFSKQYGKLDKVMTTEQFDRIVEAILAGKYSWACVLILRFAGYNPLHYIPYRTYNRLIKDNCCVDRAQTEQSPTTAEIRTNSEPNRMIKDLTYLDLAKPQDLKIKGGCSSNWVFRN
ncbi:MAG: HetP family heterocyst commitment protein [Xenococcaceae cyanobacterium]